MKHLGHKKLGKKDKSDKKLGQVKPKKEIQLLTDYFDNDQYNEAEGGNYDYYNNQAQDRKQKKSTRKDKDKF